MIGLRSDGGFTRRPEGGRQRLEGRESNIEPTRPLVIVLVLVLEIFFRFVKGTQEGMNPGSSTRLLLGSWLSGVTSYSTTAMSPCASLSRAGTIHLRVIPNQRRDAESAENRRAAGEAKHSPINA